jgi:glutathione S-transferase
MYELYQAEWCPFSHRVRQRLTELRVDFIARQVPPDKGDRTELFARSGHRSIPVLFAGERMINDPREILDYLERHHARTPDSEKHRAKDVDPAILAEREEVRRDLP